MKRFNITGICNPNESYMVDTGGKLKQILKMIEFKDYFVINRPRQYGKTTTLFLLEKALQNTDDYLPIKISFEGKAIELFETKEHFCKAFLGLLSDYYVVKKRGYSELFIEMSKGCDKFVQLSKAISEIIEKIGKKVVLLIDEVDMAGNYDIFLEFLAMLRDKYLKAKNKKGLTFHSIIFAGVRDVNNCFNIAIDFKVNMSFSPQEISTMLTDYTKETGIQMDIEEISNRLFSWTSGYPFLVSKLCKTVDEDIIPERVNKNWTTTDIDQAVQMLLIESNTLFDDMSKNLENNETLYNFMQEVVLGENEQRFELSNPIINLANMYGLIDRIGDNGIKIHNKIFAEKLSFYYISKNQTKNAMFSRLITEKPYITRENKLDLDTIMLKFQEGIKQNIGKKDKDFLENNLRLVFLMFVKTIINGKGFCFKEVHIGEEKRLDLVIVFNNEKFIIELKIWRGQQYHQDGIQQLKKYMELEAVNKGYMLIMNNNKKKKYSHEIEDGIMMVYV
jgi:hypothetical protein